MLKWFILLLATLTLSTVVSATSVLFVKPTNDTPCPQQLCHSLEHYAQSWELYLTSNTVVQFLPGEHVLEGDWNQLSVANVSNVTLIGTGSVKFDSSPPGIPMATSRISCRRGGTLFTFYNVTKLFIARLTFSECGGGEVTLFLNKVSNLVLESVTIQNSTGTGLVGHNLRESLIHRSVFVFNQATRAFSCSSGIFLLYRKCSEVIETFTLNISSSLILFGNAIEKTCSTGLHLQIAQSCYNIKVQILNTTLKGSVGGNMFLGLNGIAHNIVFITDSHLEGGDTSEVGGGMFIATVYNATQIPQLAQSNLVYISNTEFIGNHAWSGGAISILLCTGTELYINGSKFQNNVAYTNGGHIVITFISTPQTCTNMTIRISNSLFEDGQATLGGGVAVLGPTSNDSQCTNGSHIHISNSQFVGNYAQAGGGAVSLFGCIGTELYIDKTEFYNNTTPSAGGHIALLMTSDQPQNIIVNNSHFQGGQATHGSGGGVAVVGLTSNGSHCINGDHIHFSNSQFVGNYAQAGGGAVSLFGCIGTELYIDNTEFYNNTTPSAGGHFELLMTSDQPQNIIVNNSHFESGQASVGGGISVFVGGSCMSVTSTIHKSVYITNSKVYENVAEVGGGMAIQFNNSCLVVNVLLYNMSLSRNTAKTGVSTGGNIYLPNICTAGNSITISRSTVEFGSASDAGGGMAILTDTSNGCPSSIENFKPTIINIVNSTFQYNAADVRGGGLVISFDSSEYFCCSTEVNITNVKFLNNTCRIPVAIDRRELPIGGGNIFIQDNNAGQWLNNFVRIHNCQIEGGVAVSGGGILLIHVVKYAVSCHTSNKMNGLIISNTRFICNQATSAGSSLRVEGNLLKNFSMTLDSMTPVITKQLKIINSIFDGSCADSSNVIITGLGVQAPYIPAGDSVVFINVSFRGYSMNLSYPLSTAHSQLSSGWSLDDRFIQYISNPTACTLYSPQPAVMLIFVPNATFINCDFFESTVDSSLYARSTNMFFGGNITFRDNIATYGAGLTLLDNSVMYLRSNTHIVFSHNHATYAGGAIYVHSVDTRGDARCFYQFGEVNQTTSELNIQIMFENNTAYFAGSALYGGLLDVCLLVPNYGGKYIHFDSIFKVQNTDEDPSAISSDPYKVCLCNDSKPHCSNQEYSPIYTYPGAVFHVQAVVVGQKDGIVPGVVRAVLKNTSTELGDLQQSQATGKSCTTLNYTVFSSQMEETIILVTETIPGRITLQKLMMNVTMLNCPWGFTLTGAPTKCDCADELQNHNIRCNITTQTITRPPPLWIGYYDSDNNSEPPVEGVLVHDSCPFDYCKPKQLSILLNDSDKQCAFNHSGILCGACKPGLSLALGTSRCLKCSNKYLMLLFAFAVAGLALVFLLTLTNMTVSEGTTNGLVFYANIIHINRSIFFPNESTGINKIVLNILSTFISWINLDLGIETCFYNGMDMYTKAWLQFLFPIYIWTIVGGMIISSHYFTTAVKLFRRHAVKVLATLFLLSFAKLQRTIITALSFTFLTYPDGTKTVWLYDSNIEYLHGKHIPLFITALLALLFFLIPYTLALFSVQCLPKLNCQMFFWVKKLKPLFDAYTGPCKDRYRFWIGFLLIIRIVLFLIFTFGNPGLNLAAISITSTCLAFTPAVYKKVWLTVLEYSLLLNLSAISVATFYCRYTQFSGNQAVVVYVSAGTAFITFVGIMAYHLYKCTINSRVWKTVSDWVIQRSNNRELVNIAAKSSDKEEEEPVQAEMRPLMLQFNEYREPVLVYDDQDS